MKRTFLFLILLIMTAGLVRAQPLKGYDVHYYNATIRLDRADDSLWGQVTMMATADSTISQALQYVKYLVIDSVFVNNAKATVQYGDTTSGTYYVIPQSTITNGSQFQVLTYYHGHPLQEQYWSYPYSPWGGVSDADTMMFAMGVGFFAPYTGCTRHWLPCYDLPDDKADSVDLTFICPSSEITASNGVLVSNTVTPGVPPNGGERIMHWHESYPIATYLMTFVTGPFTLQEIPNADSIPFEVYALESDSVNAAKEMNERVAPILAFYDSLFAPYPFQKVGFVVTQFGSMEHQTMICLDPSAIVGNPLTDVGDNSTTAIHELSHQWWGDRVTCKTFDDAWLNEGFAHFCESLDLERLFGWKAYVTRQHNENVLGAESSADSLPLYGAATADHHNSNYPYATIYQKGAVVLGMLRQYLGDSLFFNAVRYYGNQHAYSTVTSADLEAAFEHISDQDLSWFFQEWVYGRGFPTDTVTWSPTSTGATITFHQRRDTVRTRYMGITDTFVANYFRVPVPVRFSSSTGQTANVLLWMDSVQTSMATTTLGFVPAAVKLDTDGLLLWKVAKITEIAADVTPASTQPNGLTLNVFPNPDNDQILEIELIGPQPLGEITLLICDESGKILKTEIFSVNNTNVDRTISLNGLANGNYMVIARAQSGQVSQPLSITH